MDTDNATSSLLVKPELGNREGKHVILLQDLSDICQGKIGESGIKFCGDSLKCGISTHRSRKLAIKPGLYTREQGTTVIYTQPSLDVTGLDENVITGLLERDTLLLEVQEEIVMIANQTGTTESEIDSGARNSLRKAASHKTPAKQKGLSSSNLVDLTTRILEKESRLKSVKEEDDDDAKESVTGGWIQLMPNIAGAIDSLEVGLEGQSDLLNGFGLRVHQLGTILGHYNKFLQSKGLPPSVWDSITQLVEDLAALALEVENVKKSHMARIGAVEGEAQVLKSQPKGGGGLDNKLKAVLGTWKTTIEDSAARIKALENSSSTTLPNFSQTAPRGPPTQNLPADITATLEKLIDKVTKLESAQIEKGKEGLTGAVQFGGFTFTGTKDVENWFDHHMKDDVGQLPPYGVFADPQLVLHWIWIVISGNTYSSARELRDRDAIYMSQDKLYAVEAFQHYVPLIFSGKKSTAIINTGGMDKSRLGQIPKFSDWDDASGQHGLKQQIADVISLVSESLSDMISERFSTSPELRAFASAMLHSSLAFIEALSTYMSETYNNFKDVVGDSKSVWGLVTYVVEQLFKKDFGQVRAKTIGAIDANNKASAIKMIWSAIRSVGVAKELMSHGIKNAPAVSASYVRFVLKHSNMGKVTTLVEENKNLKRKQEELESLIKEVKKTAESAKKVADQAMSKANNNKRQKKQEEGKDGT